MEQIERERLLQHPEAQRLILATAKRLAFERLAREGYSNPKP